MTNCVSTVAESGSMEFRVSGLATHCDCGEGQPTGIAERASRPIIVRRDHQWHKTEAADTATEGSDPCAQLTPNMKRAITMSSCHSHQLRMS